MKVYEIDVYLNGIKMLGKRGPPVVESDKFTRAVVKDLFPMEIGKHRCSTECKGIWTIAIGPDYTEKNTFMDCIPE